MRSSSAACHAPHAVGMRGVLTPILVRRRGVQEASEPRGVGLAQRLLAARVERRRACCRGRSCDARSRRTATARLAPGGRPAPASARSRPPRSRPTPGTGAGRPWAAAARARRRSASSAPVVNIVPCTYWVRSSWASIASITRALAVPDVHDDRPARAVEEPAPVGGRDPGALGRDGDRAARGRAPAGRRGSRDRPPPRATHRRTAGTSARLAARRAVARWSPGRRRCAAPARSSRTPGRAGRSPSCTERSPAAGTHRRPRARRRAPRAARRRTAAPGTAPVVLVASDPSAVEHRSHVVAPLGHGARRRAVVGQRLVGQPHGTRASPRTYDASAAPAGSV